MYFYHIYEALYPGKICNETCHFPHSKRTTQKQITLKYGKVPEYLWLAFFFSLSLFQRLEFQVSCATLFKVKKLVSLLNGTSFKVEKPANHLSSALPSVKKKQPYKIRST